MVKFIENKVSGVIQKLTGPVPIQTAGLAPSGSYDVWNVSDTPAPTTLVIAGAVNVVAPSASGELLVGSVASGSNGTWAGAVSYNYKWTRDGVNIPVQTTNNYAFQPADYGLRIVFWVQGVDVFGTTSDWVASNFLDFPAAGGDYLSAGDWSVVEQNDANTRKITVTITKDLPNDFRQYQVYSGTDPLGVLSSTSIAPATGTRPGPFTFSGSTAWTAGTNLQIRIALTDAGDDTNPAWASPTKSLQISGLPPALSGVEILTGSASVGDITIKIPSVTQDLLRANTKYQYRVNAGTAVDLPGETTINVARIVNIGGAVSVSVEVRAVNLNGNGPWTTPVSVTPFTALATTSLTSVTINGETYGISASSTPGTAVPAGYDQEGNAFVVGSFWIVSASTPPATEAVTARAIHGIMKNPDITENQGWDSLGGGTYNGSEAYRPTLPLQLTAGDVAVQVISRLGLGATRTPGDHRSGVILKVTCLYSVASAPAAKRLTPAVTWATPATRPQVSIDPAAILASLPAARSMAGIALSSWATVAQRLDRFDPMFGKHSAAQSTSGYERSMTWKIGADQADAANYGQDFVQTINKALMGIRGDTWSDADKKAAILRLMSFGHQWYWGLKARTASLNPDGGHWQFYWAPIIAYLNWTGQTAELAFFESNLRGHMKQANRMTAERFGEYRTPHNQPSKMAASRLRPVTLINSQTSFNMTFNATIGGGDVSQHQANLSLLVRAATGEKRVITQAGTHLTTNIEDKTVIITAPYSTNVTMADSFYREAAWPVQHGNLLWNNGDLLTWMAAHNTTYASNNTGWTIQLQFLAELGILPTFAEEPARLAVLHNLSNTPAGYDFPTLTSITDSGKELAYYNTYGATDFAAVNVPKTTAPAIYGHTATSLSGTQVSGAVNTTDAQGGFFWVAVPSGSAAPTAQQIYDRKKADNTAAPVFGEKNVAGVGATSWMLEGFTPATAYDIYFVQQDYYSNFSNVVSATVTTGATGTTYRETWAGRANNDGWTTDPAGAVGPLSDTYTRSSTLWVPTILTDTSAPSGLVMSATTSSSYRQLYLTALATRLLSPWSRMQARARVVIRNTETNRYGFGFNSSFGLHTGVRINNTLVQLQLNGSMDTATNITQLPGTAFANGDIVELLFEVGNPDKKTMRLKAWKVGPTGGIAEPAWGAASTTTNSEVSVTDTADIAFSYFGFCMVRTTTRYQGLIVTVDGDAPTF